MVTVSRASFQGRRRATGVTMVPRRMRSVARATVVSSTQGSAMSAPGSKAAWRWSHTKKPSQPARSAATASSAVTRGSA